MKKATLLLLGLLAASSAAQEKSASTPGKQPNSTDNGSAPAVVRQITQNVNDNGKNIAGKPAIVSKEGQETFTGAPESASPDKKWREPLLVSPVKRDPFRPFTLNTRATANRKRENLSPLERYELGQLKLVGIVAPDAKTLSALVEDASGLGYVVKVGTAMGINEGRVVAIRRDGLVVEEVYVDLYGAQKKREINMKLAAETSE